MKNYRQGFIGIVVIILIAVGLVGSGYYAFKNSRNKEQAPAQQQATTTDQTVTWKTYTNEKYGFSFKYPSTYIDFHPTEVISRQKGGLYLEKAGDGFSVKYKDIIPAYASYVSTSSNDVASEGITVAIYNLNSYRYAEIFGGIEYGFNTNNNTWWQNDGDHKMDIVMETLPVGNGLVGYVHNTGDGGYSSKDILIPIKTKNIMVELEFSSGESTKTNIPLNLLLSTFTFTK